MEIQHHLKEEKKKEFKGAERIMENVKSLNPVGAISDRWQDLKYTLCFRNRNSFAVLHPPREFRDRFQRGCLFVVWFSFNDPRRTPGRSDKLYYKRLRLCLFELNWNNGPRCDHNDTRTVIACNCTGKQLF